MTARRLLTTARLALKLGYVKLDGNGMPVLDAHGNERPNLALFYRNRRGLEAEGMPKPAIGNGRGQRWDEQAIDLWLDGRMPAELRKAARSAQETDWNGVLDRRAAELANA